MTEQVVFALRKVISSGGRDDADLQLLLNELEWLVDPKMRERHAHWRWESLDGVYAARVTVIDENAIEILGMCILIGDQTMTPIRIRLRLGADSSIEVSGQLGHAGDGAGGITRWPCGSMEASQTLDRLVQGVEVDWVYEF
jgi:hypothetical protein